MDAPALTSADLAVTLVAADSGAQKVFAMTGKRGSARGAPLADFPMARLPTVAVLNTGVAAALVLLVVAGAVECATTGKRGSATVAPLAGLLTRRVAASALAGVGMELTAIKEVLVVRWEALAWIAAVLLTVVRSRVFRTTRSVATFRMNRRCKPLDHVAGGYPGALYGGPPGGYAAVAGSGFGNYGPPVGGGMGYPVGDGHGIGGGAPVPGGCGWS